MVKVIIDKLLADPALSAIVGTRVRPNQASAGDSLPYCIVRRVGGGPYNTLNTGSNSYDATLQVDLIAAEYGQASEMADAAASALNGLRDLTTDPPLSMVHLTDQTDDDFTPTTGGDYPTHRIIQDYNASV